LSDTDAVPDILAVVSKAIFERDARGLAPGDVWTTRAYASQNKALAPLAGGGRLVLVTVRPPAEALWLVAVLDRPRLAKGAWTAAENAVPIREISRDAIQFANGTSLTAKPGTLGMSLQTPRVLADGVADRLLGAKSGAKPRGRLRTGVADSARGRPGSSSEIGISDSERLSNPQPRSETRRVSNPQPRSETPETRRAKSSETRRAKSSARVRRGSLSEIGISDSERVSNPQPRSGTSRAKAAEAAPARAFDDREEAALLAAWRRTHATEIADVLQLVPLDLDLAGLARQKPEAASPRIRKLPDDPRVTVFLVECLRAAKWPGSSSRTLWKNAFAKLVELRDPRALAPLRAAVATPPRFLGAGFTKDVVAAIAAAADALERVLAPAAVPDDVAALVAAHRAQVPKRGWLAPPGGADPEVEALLARVYAAPDDRDLRSVVGDALLERDDPWGELIALQMRGTNSARVNELVRKHGGRFAGAVSLVATRDDMTFEDGFLAEVMPDKQLVGRRYWEEAIAAPQWATVHTVTIGYNTPTWWVGAWLANARLGRLRVVTLGAAEAVRDSPTGVWTLRTKNVRADSMTSNRIDKFAKGLPPAELARIPEPKSPWLRTQLATIRARRA
jgi:uncharacterized protein (TIGR02996 family)